MTSSTDLVRARDGSNRLVRRWATATDTTNVAGEPWAHVLLLHGLGEHSGRYEAVGEWLAAAGIDVESLDHVGNGGSDGRRGDVPRWSVFHDDVEDRLAAVRSGAADRPVVLYGHSMGGLMALGYVLGHRPRPDLLVLSAPGLDDALPEWKHALASVLGRLVPRLTVPNGVPGEVLSRDPAVGAAYLADPLNVHHSTTRLGREGFAEQARVRAALDRLDIPTYVFHGADDDLVPPAATEPLGRLAGVTRVVLPGLRHETHNEPEGRIVIDGVIDWLRGRVQVAGVQTEHAGD